ncbi:hypothetical protein [Streptomyces sp. NBC_01236]|uniref:hypothetical protein n=1 Tax=Streptomyces sp. NBC_01236 TaxID=2903789 RepID=UPI002E10370D|nr:hypothetical protein OG324_04185 [Streptomyces sp. NBC_01236]
MSTDASTGAGAPLLLDGALPDFRFARLESTAIAAPPGVVFGAARDLDLRSVHSPLLDAVMWVRVMPDKLRNRIPPPLPEMRVAHLFDLASKGEQPWMALGENPGRELVFGAVGKVWKPSIEWRWMEPEDFTPFDEPGWAKMAAAFVVHPYGARRTLLTYEARTVCTDPESTARFLRYWTLVSGGVGIVLRATLKAVKEAAERESGPYVPLSVSHSGS